MSLRHSQSDLHSLKAQQRWIKESHKEFEEGDLVWLEGTHI